MRNLYAELNAKTVNASLKKAALLGSAEAKLGIDNLIARRKWSEAAAMITDCVRLNEISKEDGAALMRRIQIEQTDAEKAARN